MRVLQRMYRVCTKYVQSMYRVYTVHDRLHCRALGYTAGCRMYTRKQIYIHIFLVNYINFGGKKILGFSTIK